MRKFYWVEVHLASTTKKIQLLLKLDLNKKLKKVKWLLRIDWPMDGYFENDI